VEEIRHAYGPNKPTADNQFALWLEHVVTRDLGRSLATGPAPVWGDLSVASATRWSWHLPHRWVGFRWAARWGGVAGAYRGTWIDRTWPGTAAVVIFDSKYWLGMGTGDSVQRDAELGSPRWAKAGARRLELDRVQHLMPAPVTLSIIRWASRARTVRASSSEVLGQDFATMLRARACAIPGFFLHVVRNAAPTVPAVMGCTSAYLMGGLDPWSRRCQLARHRPAVNNANLPGRTFRAAGHGARAVAVFLSCSILSST